MMPMLAAESLSPAPALIHSPSPELCVLDGLITRTQCDDLIARAKAQGFSRAKQRSVGRDNDELFIIDRELTAALLERLSAVSPARCIDDLVEIYRYGIGDSIAEHSDGPRRMVDDRISTATLLIYLNDGFDGGETVFPTLDLAIRPVRTRAIVFAHGVRHAAKHVTTGEKLVARVNISDQS